jgi:hypothetical protein
MKRRSLTAKMLRLLCVGYVVLFNGWLALSFAGMSLESFHPRYQVSQVASGIKFAALGLALLSIGLGVAFGYRWARWVSIALGALGLCLSVFLFWDGFLRIKSAYSGEESSEVFMALVFFMTSVLVVAAMLVPVAKGYFDAEDAGKPNLAESLDPTS